MATVTLVGSTGLVGGYVLTTLLASSPKVSRVHAYTRRELPQKGETLETILEKDTSKWVSLFPPSTTLFISGLGTTRGAAGSLANQRLIDYDLNLDLAKAAKAAGVKTYVLISAASAASSSMLPYSKMKGELEDAVVALGFEHTVILRPGLIAGQREESRPGEWVFRKIADVAGSINPSLKNFWAQDVDVIAKAAVSAGLKCTEGTQEKGLWVLGQSDIVRVGRNEWKDASK